MKASTESLPERQLLLHIQAEPQEVEESLEGAYRLLRRNLEIPGFRRGKAPRAIVERFVGREALLKEALEESIPKLYRQALEEQKLEPISPPEIDIVQREPLVFKAKVSLPPVVELGDYRDLRMPPEGVNFDEGDVAKVLEELRHQHALWEPVDREARFGDMVMVDIEGAGGGKKLLEEKNFPYQLTEQNTTPIPGFASKLTGMNKGEVREFSLTFPTPDKERGVGGEDYQFKVALKEVKEKHLPLLDDDFAKGVGEGFENLKKLEEHLNGVLKARAEAAARRRFEEKALDALVETAKVELPPVLVEGEIEALLREERSAERRAVAAGGKSPEERREELRPLARKRIVRSLVLEKVAQAEKIEVSSQEVDAEVGKLAQGVGERGPQLRQALSRDENRNSLSRLLLAQKTLERLASIAKEELEGEGGGSEGRKEEADATA